MNGDEKVEGPTLKFRPPPSTNCKMKETLYNVKCLCNSTQHFFVCQSSTIIAVDNLAQKIQEIRVGNILSNGRFGSSIINQILKNYILE